MKALLKLKPEPGLTLEEMPLPVVGDQDVLIKIKTSGICGTDLHIYDWNDWAQKTIPLPLIVGHEFMGEIASIGKDVYHLKEGDRVSGEGHITCGICRLCRSPKRHLCANAKGIGIHRNGAFAEYISLPAPNVVKVPQVIPDDIAAILDPIGNAVHTVHAADVVGEDVLVTGAGPIGLMVVALLKQLGAHSITVTDINPFRLDLAKKMGATNVINVKDSALEDFVNNLKLENGFTVGFEMSGKPAGIQTQLALLAPGSTLAVLGVCDKLLTVDWNQIVFKGLNVQGIYGRELFETWVKMTALLQTGLNLAPLITHHYPYQDFQSAFQMAKSGEAGKVLLHWEEKS